MPTTLDKDLIRETTIKVDDREIILTLTKSQEIKFKLKGMKSGELKIDIEQLYNQLSGREVKTDEPKTIKSIKREEKVRDDVTISLYELRSLNAITGFDIPTMNKLDSLLAELIENKKKK